MDFLSLCINNNYAAWLIIILSITILPLYLGTQMYLSFKGILLSLLFGVVIYLRTYVLAIPNRLYVPDTFTLTGSLTFLGILIMIFIMRILSRDKKLPFNKKYFWLVLIFYIPFGLAQQLFFFYSFAETIYYLFPHMGVAISVSSLFYAVFHLRLNFNLFTKGTFYVGLFWSITYLVWGNILWNTLSHIILAPIYYSWFLDSDVLALRLKIKT